ncbi:SusD/RagB family nutrient-binding outer membrane lipoprotein [Ilyomonas limi]|uniref:SusD/RagB family nutrient-binding outer membrane lipoprotein n=1 Tax=Ilyomonas limi TaxID=2575867 RepID=A0A4U3L8Z8_9BACT|nr:SusD/RagB family nutrient-binding outer membrane lipoprotein [Ilyomonas limi]TKK71560.1 SusD/RagB family nutrient-binding outer membrane lipoprotein [Ilyomonas limi]
MKKVIIYSACLVLLIQTSCTKKFDEINTNPSQTTADLFNANYLLAEGEWEYSNTGYNQLLFESMWSQVLASTYGYYGNGDKYIFSGSFTAYRNALWNADYRAASLIYEMQNLVKDNPDMSNLYNVGTLMKVIIMQRITDVYGDIPYSEALQAKAGITQPKYDSQQDIYNSMLTEVETAVNALDASKTTPTNDVIYGGDIAKWKRFGYSLMLRLAMRLTKVDPATAQTWAEKAAAGGTFTSIEDNAKVKGDNATGFSNANTNALTVADDYREVRWSEPFIDYLKATDDPRLSAIAEVSQSGLANNANQALAGNNDPAVQIGMPNGYDLNGGATDIRSYSKYPGPSGTGDDVAPVGKYSRPRTAVYLDRSGINMILTYPEIEYLLAEAKERGWNVGATSAAQHYANGLAGAMASLQQFNSAAAISASTISAYVTAHPLDESSTDAAIAQINTQYWVATGSFFEFVENWINWRRSGYPVLDPVNYPGQFTNSTIPRRIPYESNEPANNPVNYNEAVSRQGPDDWATRVWWDIQ